MAAIAELEWLANPIARTLGLGLVRLRPRAGVMWSTAGRCRHGDRTGAVALSVSGVRMGELTGRRASAGHPHTPGPNHLSRSTRTIASTAVAALLLAGCSNAVFVPAVPSSGSTTARSSGGQIHLGADGWDASVPSAGSLTLTAHPDLPAASRSTQFGVTPATEPVGLTLSGAPFPAAGATLATVW